MAYRVSRSREVSTAKSVSLAAATMETMTMDLYRVAELQLRSCRVAITDSCRRRDVSAFDSWSLVGDTSAQLPFAGVTRVERDPLAGPMRRVLHCGPEGRLIHQPLVIRVDYVAPVGPVGLREWRRPNGRKACITCGYWHHCAGRLDAQ